MSDFTIIAAMLRTEPAGPAPHPEDVFGEPLTLADLPTVYRRIALVVHPDHFAGGPLEKLADRTLARLNDLREAANRKLQAGSYGRRDIAPPAPPSPPAAPLTVAVGKHRYTVTDRLYTGDVCDLYACEATYREGSLFKVAQHPADNDLVENEAKVLAHLVPKGKAKLEVHVRLLPTLYNSFLLRGAKTNRRVNVMERFAGHHTLTEVRNAYPAGLDFRDMAWMFKRLLMVLSYAHRMGVVHGAVLPEHVLINPDNHGAKLLDWCYAVQGAGRIKAISKANRHLYPPEVLGKFPCSPATDIYMAAECAMDLLRGNASAMPRSVPQPILAFIGSCLLRNPTRRPADAGQLHEEFDQLLARLVGPRVFRPFSMPAVAP